jgi:FAD synthase
MTRYLYYELFGLGGMKAENVSVSLLVKLRLYAPYVVFIHIGANDISKDSSCKTICRNIQFVGEIYKAGVKVVFVAEICQRDNFTKTPGLTFQIITKIRTLSTGHYRNSLVTIL